MKCIYGMDYLRFMGLVYLMLTDTQRPLVASFVVLHINTVDHEASTVLNQNVCIPGRYELTFFKHFFQFFDHHTFSCKILLFCPTIEG